MKIFIISLFPNEMRDFFLKGLFQKAQIAQKFEIEFINLRDFAVDKHHKVDDTPFGNTIGMLLKADIVARAIQSIENYRDYRLLYTCPKGQVFNQTLATQYAETKGLIIICGYYEGLDERVFDLFKVEKVSVGNFVLSSGELPALLITEAVIRLKTGVVGCKDSVAQDSIVSGLLEFPQYTKPRLVDEVVVPEVLVSGNHALIAQWQRQMAIKETLFHKPAMLATAELTVSDQENIVKMLLEEEDAK